LLTNDEFEVLVVVVFGLFHLVSAPANHSNGNIGLVLSGSMVLSGSALFRGVPQASPFNEAI
jgi:hypothetical protein